jgi:hypothetical protein
LLCYCGYKTVVADAIVCEAIGCPEDERSIAIIDRWVRQNRLTILGVSYRLDPADGEQLIGRLIERLKRRGLLSAQGAPLKAMLFAGLPQTCQMVKTRHPEIAGVFQGDETPTETLRILGINLSLAPRSLVESAGYDESRLAFGRDLIRSGRHLAVKPVNRAGYDAFGTDRDTVVARINHSMRQQQPPLMRVHIGPYLPDRRQAVQLFLDWTRQLAASGLVDVLSIGTSQLTQSRFGEQWGSAPNGGGVPLASEQEFAAVWKAARPMLVRTYAGTKNIPALAEMYERTIHIAWHALSFWWFCRTDGRGPNTLIENLRQHIETLGLVARSGKPFEPNIPHHFAFRGADDVTCIVAAILAARTAKRIGVRYLILQTMLNTPKGTWGVQDLAKARALLQLARQLEACPEPFDCAQGKLRRGNDYFRVFLQPRAGLDYFSPNAEKAKAQLAAATALLDDIEPQDPASPPLIHVVSYSEAFQLADPAVANESIMITRCALDEYRRLRGRGYVDDMTEHPQVQARTAELVRDAKAVLDVIDQHLRLPISDFRFSIKNPKLVLSAAEGSKIENDIIADGLYKVFASGLLPVPYLWECRDEFHRAVEWRTRLVDGKVLVVDENDRVISTEERIARMLDDLG